MTDDLIQRLRYPTPALHHHAKQAADEIERLREELDALKAQPAQEPVAWIDAGDLRGVCNGNSAWVHPDDQGRMVPLYAAPQPTHEVERDAARYRWLRDNDDALAELGMCDEEALDEHIDATMQKRQP